MSDPGRRLVGFFAHPSDEAFSPGGMMARYARDGVEVSACIATDGAVGSYDPSLLAAAGVPTLAALRAQELGCAAQELGVRVCQLGYRDSGMSGSPDNQHPESLFQAGLDDVARKIDDVFRTVRPQVVVTHDATGGYFHPDHIKLHRAVMRALELAQVGQDGTRDGLPPWLPQRVYFNVLPQGEIRWLLRILRLMGRDPRHFGRNGDIDLTQIGVPDRFVHVRLDVRNYVAVKERASACHRSQGGGGLPRWVPPFLRQRFLRTELYQQGYPEGAVRHSDFFEGLS